MYEYDVYADARRTIPRLREPLQTLDGEYFLVKVDPLAQTMTFSTSKGAMANLTTLPIWRVKEILAINRAGEKAETLMGSAVEERVEEPTYRSEEDSITRFDNKGKKSKRNKRRNNKEGNREGGKEALKEGKDSSESAEPKEQPKEQPKQQPKPQPKQPKEQQKPQLAQGNDEANAPAEGATEGVERQGRGERRPRRNPRGRRNGERRGERGAQRAERGEGNDGGEQR